MDNFQRRRRYSRRRSGEATDEAKQRFEKAEPTIANSLLKVIEEAENKFKSSKPDSGSLSNFLHLYAQLIKLTSKIARIKEDISRQPPILNHRLFSSFIESVKTFDYYLSDLDYTLIELYNPNLARSIISVVGSDVDFFYYYNKEIVPKFKLDKQDVPESLKHYLRDFSGDFGYQNDDIAYLDVELTGQQIDYEDIALNTNSIGRINELCNTLLECKKKLSEIITANWSVKEVFEINNNKKIEITMGDKFENIHHSTIYNRLVFTEAFNTVKTTYSEEAAQALETVKTLVEKSGNRDAGEIFDSFNEEIKKEKPKKSIISSLWDGLIKVVPMISQTVGLIDKISPLFHH